MAKEAKPKVFICYAGEDHSLMEDFIERFKLHNDLEPLYDKTPHSGNMYERFRGFASECDVAILLVNAKFTNLASYANKYEMPILLERQKQGELGIIGVRFSDVDMEEWNKKGDIYFFQIRNDDLANTRRKDENGDIFNRQFAVYELIDKRDRNTFHVSLKKWIDKTLSKKIISQISSDKIVLQDYDKKFINENKADTNNSTIGYLIEKKPSNKLHLYIVELNECFSSKDKFSGWYMVFELLNQIGNELNNTIPAYIQREELELLLISLNAFKNVILYDGPFGSDSQTMFEHTNILIAELSIYALKEPSRRSVEDNLHIMQLGNKIMTVANYNFKYYR